MTYRAGYGAGVYSYSISQRDYNRRRTPEAISWNLKTCLS
jgi:hypothetical protein